MPERYHAVEIEPDPVIDAYKDGIDRTLLMRNLTLSPEDRFRQHAALQAFALELRRAGQQARGPKAK